MNRHKVYTVTGVLAGAALLAGAWAGTASAMASGNGGNRTGAVHGNGHVKEGGHNVFWTWGSTWGKPGDWTGAVHGNGYIKGDGYSASWSW